MRFVVLALSLLVASPAAAQTPYEEMTAMLNESIERGNREREAEERYNQMRQDYINDTQQAIRQEREDYEALQRLRRNSRPKLPSYAQDDNYEPLGSDF